MIDEHTRVGNKRVGKLEIGPGPWQTLGQLLDQLPSTAEGTRYLAGIDEAGSGKTITELIEAGEIQNVIEQPGKYLDRTAGS